MIERRILAAAARLRSEGTPYIVGTVVCVSGSSYRRPGARVIVGDDGTIAGSISGGCLEADAIRKAWWRTRAGERVVITYDSRATEGEFDGDEGSACETVGLGCNGVIDVMFERCCTEAIDPIAVAETCIRLQRPGAVATVFRSTAAEVSVGARVAIGADGTVQADPLPSVFQQRLAVDARSVAATGTTATRAYTLGGGGIEVAIEALVPPPRIYLFGAGFDAVPVVELVRRMGWEAIVCAPTARPTTRARFAAADQVVFGPPAVVVDLLAAAHTAAVVVMGHDYERDRAALRAVLDSRAVYVGVLGPRHRTDRMLAELGRGNLDHPRLRAPIGLELGAETPEQIALAIVAEMQAVFAGASAAEARAPRRPHGTIHDLLSTMPEFPLAL